MLSSRVATAALFAASLSVVLSSSTDSAPLLAACDQIKDAISAGSLTSFPGSPQYEQDISHFAVSSSAASACSVEPGNPSDVGEILRILGASKIPFAVKGGGHASNPGFSSTVGVQIAMSRFNQVQYDNASQTVTFGSGVIWDDVYAALEPFGVTAIGGRVTGVGVAGFTLGGGYSWKTNQYGLTVDTVTAFGLVLPNGTVTTVTEEYEPELFFGLKGGYNNFGIVTSFTLKTFPQTEVWGGVVVYNSDHIEELNAAVTKFSRSNRDPKAVVLPTYSYFQGGLSVLMSVFYDAPKQPEAIFDDFFAIPTISVNVSTRPYLEMITSFDLSPLVGARELFHGVPILDYSPRLLNAIVNETTFWGTKLLPASAFWVSVAVEPFLPTILSHAPASSAAYPPTRALAYSPLNVDFSWTARESDELMRDSIRQSAETLTRVAVADGQAVGDAPLYGNYALVGTPEERIFGPEDGETFRRLRALKAKYDPDGVMDLAGGWKI